MKFLLELVSCCGWYESYGGGRRSDPESPSEESTLVPVVRRSYRRRRRGGSGDGRSAGEWKPSLFAISEDNVVVMERQRNESNRDRVVKRKTRDFKRDDIRRSSLPTFIPAFSPTPFMF